jgi:hypothetical protein
MDLSKEEMSIFVRFFDIPGGKSGPIRHRKVEEIESVMPSSLPAQDLFQTFSDSITAVRLGGEEHSGQTEKHQKPQSHPDQQEFF